MVPPLSLDRAFSEAFIHDEHSVYLRPLAPFCLRHYIYLKGLNSPLFSGGKVCARDLQIAAVVCSTSSHKEVLAWLAPDNKPAVKWFRQCNRLDLEKEMKAWGAYIDDFFPEFPMWEKDGIGAGDDVRVPGHLIMAAGAMEILTRDEVMNLPIGEVRAWSMARCAYHGSDMKHLMSETEYAAVKAIQEEG